MVQGNPYVCKKAYTPKKYVGLEYVPADCLTTTPSACQRSWKAGIPQGRATSKPYIYSAFIFCHEGFSSCGYVPINPKTGVVVGGSGVTVGAGVDLGSQTRSSPIFRSLPDSFIAKLEPYLGIRQDMAACAAIEKPLHLFSSEALTLTNIVKEYIVEKVEQRYNVDRARNAVPFISLPRGIRTALVSFWFQFGHPEAYPSFWKLVGKNNWEKAVKMLRNFYADPQAQRLQDLRRRHDEADIIEATLVKCNRALDAVVLLDESGSVSLQNFKESLQFVKNITTAFPDAKLRGDYGTRLGLSTFSNVYTPHFYLSSYSSQSQYLTAVDGVPKSGGTTSLGYALSRVIDQFTESRGLRNERYGIPRILIVLTDGKSHDRVKPPAQRLRQKNIVIYAIGVGDYDILQLEEVASSPSHAFTLSTFVQLESFIGTLTAATCNEPQPITLRKQIGMTTNKMKFQYFVYKARSNSMLEIKVKDLTGQTFVYASRSNPHPYEFDHDVGFKTSNQKEKVLVISLKDRNSTVKRSIHDGMKPIYVSVLANTEIASFTIEGNACNPLNCTEGTNEKPLPSSRSSSKKTFSFFTLVAINIVLFYLVR